MNDFRDVNVSKSYLTRVTTKRNSEMVRGKHVLSIWSVLSLNKDFFPDIWRYLIPIKIRALLNFAPLIFAPLIFVHPQISRPFNFRASLFYYNLPFFHSFVALFLLHLIFAHSHCVNLLPLISAEARCAKIKWAQILMGIR